MMQSSSDPDFAQETLRAERRTQFWIQNLDRHLASVSQILRRVDGRHAAGAEHTTDHVAARERRFQLLDLLSYVHVLRGSWDLRTLARTNYEVLPGAYS